MPEPDDLTDHLRRLAERLDAESTTTSPSAAMARTPAGDAPPRRRLRLAAGLTVAAVAAVTVVALVDASSDRPVESGPGPTAAPTPNATTTTVDDATSDDGIDHAVPAEAWPASGIAVVEGARLVFLDESGEELGTLRLATLTGPEISSGGDLRGLVVLNGGTVELEDVDAVEGAPGCEGARGAGGLRVALCDDLPTGRPRVAQLHPDGTRNAVIDVGVGPEGDGEWAWAIPSPDGRWVLTQWTGGCDVAPTTLVGLVGRGDRSFGGPVTGTGWSPDGRAIVQVASEGCGDPEQEPGTYLIDPDTGAETLLRRQTSLAVRWRRATPFANAPERAIGRALDELGLDGCCGEPSHGGANATTGAVWDGTEVPIFGGPTADLSFEGAPYVPFNDLVIASEVAVVAGVPVTVGEADLGPFLAFTCGEHLWTLGGAGLGERAEAAALRNLASALIPHLYCTVGERPLATGHGTP